MNNNGKINHAYKIIGLILILLAVTTFARGETFTFDCTDEFNCSIKSYCGDVPGAVPGLIVMNGEAFSYPDNEEPTEYSFTSSHTGEAICSATVTVTAMHDQDQTNETTTIYVNGTNLGTTQDNYCNADGGECTFCGRDVQTLPGKEVILSQNNTLKIEGHDSHAVVSVSLNCQPYGKNCAINLGPTIENIDDRNIPYDSSFRIDLWNYIEDLDDSFSDLIINQSTSGEGFSCTLDQNRYLSCTSTKNLGQKTVTITVTDPCNKTATENFIVTVENKAPYLFLQDETKSCASDMNKFIDLHDYSWDEEITKTNYEILSQSNTNLLNCSIDNNHYLSCVVNNCGEDYSDIRIRITDIFGVSGEDTVRISLANTSPFFTKNLPYRCINEDEYKIIDLREYTTDLEDKNNLTFSLSQNNATAANCFIDDTYYVSCTDVSNRKETNILTIIARDTANATAQQTMEIETQCHNNFDFDSNTKNICLEDCTTNSTRIKLTNNKETKECFSFIAEANPYTLETNLSNNDFCLNSGQTTYLTLSARACGTDTQNYEVRVFDYEQDLELIFDYDIGSCNNFDGFRVREYDGKICQGEKRTFTVDVKNTSNEEKKIYLDAENQLLLPYFSRKYLIIGAGEEKAVDLTINAKYASLGYQNIFLSGNATNYIIEKRMELEVVDCSDIKERNFMISAPQVCYDVRRGQEFEGSFNVKRFDNGTCAYCNYGTKGIELFLIGMRHELAYDMLDLRASQEKKVNYSLFVPENAKAGTHFVTIAGNELSDGPFDDEIGFVDDETICLNVLGESNSKILLRTQTKDITWCDSEIFELEIINTGDFDETFTLSAQDIPIGVSVFFSEEEVTVPKKSSKIIYVSIATDTDSKIGDNQSIKVLIEGNINLETKIYFNIKEKEVLPDLEILSFSNVIAVKQGEEAEYSLIIRNNSNRDFVNVNIDIENLPSDANFQSSLIQRIVPGEIVKVRGKLIAGDTNGLFFPVFVVSTRQLMNKETFTLVIESKETQEGSFLGGGTIFGTGLFTLFSEGSLAVVLSVLLILLLLIIILALTVYRRPMKKEAWLEVEQK